MAVGRERRGVDAVLGDEIGVAELRFERQRRQLIEVIRDHGIPGDLIARAELDITSVSLAMVTDQYLGYIRGIEQLNMDEISAFLVIATGAAARTLPGSAGVASGAKVLVIAAIDGTTLSDVLQKAHDSGAVVISYDRLITKTANVDYYATFDNFGVGVIQGTQLLEGLGLKPGEAAPAGVGPFNVELFGGSPDDTTRRIRELPLVRTVVRKQDIRDTRRVYWEKVKEAEAALRINS